MRDCSSPTIHAPHRHAIGRLRDACANTKASILTTTLGASSESTVGMAIQPRIGRDAGHGPVGVAAADPVARWTFTDFPALSEPAWPGRPTLMEAVEAD